MGILRSTALPQALQQIRNRVLEVVYDTRDDFITPRLPGAVNGTAAEPGPGTRVVTDTGNNLSISSGWLNNNGFVGAGDPGLWYGGISRIAGLMVLSRVLSNNYTSVFEIGFDANQATSIRAGAFRIVSNYIYINANGISAVARVYDVVNSVEYALAIVTRDTGFYFFVDNKLVWIDDTDTQAVIYPGISNGGNGLQYSFDYLSIPKKLWLPKPLLSDGFALASVPDAVDYGGVNDGAYTRCGLSGEVIKAYFDGTNSYCSIYSADLNSKFNGLEVTTMIRGKVNSTARWADGVDRFLFRFYVDANNLLAIKKTVVNNQIQHYYAAGGVASNMLDATYAGEAGWFTVGLTGSDSNNRARAYKNGVEIAASPSVNAGVWTGNLSANNTLIGAQNNVPTLIWGGWLSDMIVVFGVEASATQMLTIHTHLDAGTLTEDVLNDEFGFGAWSWWKLNENFISNGLGHAEGIAGSIGAGGDGLLYEQPYGAWDCLTNSFHCSFIQTISGWGTGAIAVTDCKTSDVIVTGEATIAGFGAGVVARYTDNNNLIFCFHTGANLQLVEVVAGASNVLVNAAAAYGAGNPIRLILEGNAARAYYNDVLIGTATINSDLPDATEHGVISFSVDETIDNLVIYARGSDGEYTLLEGY